MVTILIIKYRTSDLVYFRASYPDPVFFPSKVGSGLSPSGSTTLVIRPGAPLPQIRCKEVGFSDAFCSTKNHSVSLSACLKLKIGLSVIYMIQTIVCL